MKLTDFKNNREIPRLKQYNLFVKPYISYDFKVMYETMEIWPLMCLKFSPVFTLYYLGNCILEKKTSSGLCFVQHEIYIMICLGLLEGVTYSVDKRACS